MQAQQAEIYGVENEVPEEVLKPLVPFTGKVEVILLPGAQKSIQLP